MLRSLHGDWVRARQFKYKDSSLQRSIAVRFVLCEEERDPSVADGQSPDMLYVAGRKGYRRIVEKVIGMLRDAVRSFRSVRFIVKLDDDSVVIIPRLLAELVHQQLSDSRALYWGCHATGRKC